MICKKAGKKFPGIELVVRTIYCNDMSEVEFHYANADIGIMRTHRDAIQASGMHTEFGISLARANAVSSAVPIIIRGFSGKHPAQYFAERSRAVRRIITREWMPYAVTYYDIVKSQKHFSKHFTNAAVLAVGLVTVRYQCNQASMFWPMVADDSGLSRKDPPKVLREKIIELYGSKIRYTQIHYSRLIAVAWNAFFEDRKIASLRVTTDDTAVGGYPPIKLLGTPHKGKRVIRPNIEKLLS